MYVLIDTNIFISREADRITPTNLTKLESTLKKNNVNIIIHPLAIVEVSNYENENRRKIALSKIEAYPQLQNPPDFTKDAYFSTTFNGNSQSEFVDNSLLYAVFKNSVDFLITEDKGLLIKANSLGLKQRVLLIDEALEFFQELFKEATITKPPALKEDYVYNLNLKDHIFDGLREDYTGFDDWFNKTAKAQRKCFVSYKQDGTIGAVEIYKDENEPIHATPSLPQKKRLKICTLKVADNGYKLGELLLKLMVQYCIKKSIDEMYLTHFTKENDTLVNLISEYGFRKASVKRIW